MIDKITNLVEQLRRDEGFRNKPYKDTVGKLTIGIGRNLDDVGISVEEAEFLLANDIELARRKLAITLPWTNNLDPIRQAVLVNMTFNMGMTGLLQFRRTLGMIQIGQYAQAAEEMLKSEWAKQVGPRADRLSEQMKKGEWQ